MKLSEFDYHLPDSLIAQKPVHPRDHSKLLLLNRQNGKITHKHFYDIVDDLRFGDVLVVNNSKVIPARLIGQKKTGGKAEIFLNHEIRPGVWEVIGRGLKPGAKVFFDNSELVAEVLDKKEEIYTIQFNQSGEYFFKSIERIGETPIPPYIHHGEARDEDKKEYQTTYAKERGSVAAPTAGFHFTPDLLEKIKCRGVTILEITLHVGLGTFSPVKSENIEDHKIHREYYSVRPEIFEGILKAKKEGRRIIAVGTTTTRVLEHLCSLPSSSHSQPSGLSGWTEIFIYPGYRFRCIDAMVTNFHLPKSTLLMLVSAFAGGEKIKKAYNEAIKQKYRFYSYGDAMFIY